LTSAAIEKLPFALKRPIHSAPRRSPGRLALGASQTANTGCGPGLEVDGECAHGSGSSDEQVVGDLIDAVPLAEPGF
jgi:hypothetical protein